MRISDWSSDVCSSDLEQIRNWREGRPVPPQPAALPPEVAPGTDATHTAEAPRMAAARLEISPGPDDAMPPKPGAAAGAGFDGQQARSEEHTSELQSLMRISYAVFCLKKKTKHKTQSTHNEQRYTNTQK